MRRLLATLTDFNGFTRTLIGALLICFAAGTAMCDSLRPDAPTAGTSDQPACGSDEIVVYQSNQPSIGDPPCGAHLRTSPETAEARAYLVETAKPGYTMTRQGPELAIERLHPEFAVRLANAVREAREAGLPFAGIFSAYRPPAFGVGGFADKFNSLHAYGLAVDVHGIGRPGSLEALIFHEIAAKHGVVCPYGPRNRAEWNHCQPTRLRIVRTENPLRETITAQGPLSLETMFELGNSVIDSPEAAADVLAKNMPAPEFAEETTSAERIKPKLARFKVRWKPVDRQATASSQKDEKDSDAKPGNGHTKRAAKISTKKRVAASNKNKSKDNGRGHGNTRLAERRVAKKVSRLADKKMRARLQLVKPAAIMVEERRRPSRSGRG
jgi:hypothetical protein